jgi:hypothetical protein
MDPICQPRTAGIEDANDRGLRIQNGGTCEAIKLESASMQEATATQHAKDAKSTPSRRLFLDLLS